MSRIMTLASLARNFQEGQRKGRRRGGENYNRTNTFQCRLMA